MACYRDSFTFLYDLLIHLFKTLLHAWSGKDHADGAVEANNRRRNGIIRTQKKRKMKMKLNLGFGGPVPALSYLIREHRKDINRT
jgi:hypothetical protein